MAARAKANSDTLDGGSSNNYLADGVGSVGDPYGSSPVSGNNHLSGEDGNDTLKGGVDSDSLIGGTGNDSLVAGFGYAYYYPDDSSSLVFGNNYLNGGYGNDSLNGGYGNDTFAYTTDAALSIDVDIITDFHKVVGDTDKIVLSKQIFTTLTSNIGIGFSNESEFAVVSNNGAVATSNAFIVYNQGTGDLFYNQNGSLTGLGTGAEFATLTNHPFLAATDFVIQA